MTRPSRSEDLAARRADGLRLNMVALGELVYICGFSTWRAQKPEIRKRKTATPAYWKTAILPAANLGSSREDRRRQVSAVAVRDPGRRGQDLYFECSGKPCAAEVFCERFLANLSGFAPLRVVDPRSGGSVCRFFVGGW